MDASTHAATGGSTLGQLPQSLEQLRFLAGTLQGGAAPQPWLSALAQMADGQDTLRLCFNLAQDADADVFYQIVLHTRHPLDVNMCDAAFSPPAARTVLAALRLAGPRLRAVCLRGTWLGRSSVKALLQDGLACTSLDLSACRNLRGKLGLGPSFAVLTTLVLDANPGIQNLTQACFPALPQLTSLSLCASGLANLWTTCAALAPLTSLRQLALQRCACCAPATTAACTGRPAAPRSPLPPAPHQRPLPLQWATALADEDSFADDRDSPASLPPLSEDDSIPMLVEVSEGSAASAVEEEGDDGEVYATPRPFLSRHLLDLTDALQEEAGAPDERFFTPLLRAESSLSGDFSDSGASSLTLGAAWDDQDAATCSAEAGPSRHGGWNDRVEQQEGREGHGEAMEHDAGQDRRGHIGGDDTSGAPEQDAMAEAGFPGSVAEERGEGGAASYVEVSPICAEQQYRTFMLVHLPSLTVLDNKRVAATEREQASAAYRDHFAGPPPQDCHSGRVLAAMRGREVGSGGRGPSCLALRRTLGGAVAARSVWPAMGALSGVVAPVAEAGRRYRPRQFEYSPRVAGLMVLGTLSGEVVVLNHETQQLVGRVHTAGAPHSVLGLSWLNTHPAKLIAGCDNGAIQMIDVDRMRASLLAAARRCPRLAQPLAPDSALARLATGGGTYATEAATQTYAAFEQLTSVHVNCTDQVFLASGYSSHIGLYDINTGKRVQTFQDLHREHINVLKFAHHSPSLFVTSSFDKDIKMWDLRMPAVRPLYTVRSSKGNVMCCFSPDDAFLLSSAVDNEVRQHCAADGRPHLTFDLAPTGSTHNYTRSYYMNGRDYIISGSCEENVVRLCCARTGRRLRDVTLEGRAMKGSLYVQSLRGDPFRDFHFSVLAAYNTPNARSEIVKVNLLSKGEAKAGRIHMEIDDDVALGA